MDMEGLKTLPKTFRKGIKSPSGRAADPLPEQDCILFRHVSQRFSTSVISRYKKSINNCSFGFPMPIAHIPRDAASAVYFVTPTVRHWHYVFDRHDRWHILAESLRFLQERRGLEIFGFVFMFNHLHLIIRAPDTAACLRDFKRYTAQRIHENMRRHEAHLLPLFTDEKGWFQVWKPDNQPKIIETERFFLQKLNYIHENPVRKGYVERSEYWKWSSANPHCPLEITRPW